MKVGPLHIGQHDVQLFTLVTRGMSGQHFQRFQRRSAGVQRRIHAGCEPFADVTASDVWLGRVAVVDIKPPPFDKLASSLPLEVRAAHDVVDFHVS